MFRFSTLCAAGNVFKPRLLLSNTGLLHTLKYRTQTYSYNWQLRTFSTVDVLGLMNSSNVDLNKDTVVDFEKFKRSLIKKTVPGMLNVAKNVSDVQLASIYVGCLCERLSHFNDVNFTEMVMKDDRLLNIFSYFSLDNENKEQVPDTFILNLLFSLYKLHPFQCPLITVAETHIISQIDKFSEKDLLRLLEFFSQKKVSLELTESFLQLFNKTVYRLQENCKEFKDPNHLISATYYLLNLNMPDAANNILEQSNKLISKFNAKQLCSILFLIAVNADMTITKLQQNKIVDLLKEFNLNELNVNVLNKLLYSCGKFKIYETDLLENVTSALKQTYTQTNSALLIDQVVHTIRSLRILRWKDSKLLELTLNLFEPNSKNSRPILSALACLDYSIPDKLRYFADKVYVEDRLISQFEKLDLVWTLVIFERADAKHIASIINPQFIASVCPDLSCVERDIVTIQKLQNISLAGRLEFGMPSETMLLDSYSFDLKETSKSNSMSEILLLALSKISDGDGIKSKTVIGGHFIDALLHVNSDTSIEKLENITPENLDKYHRICIKIQCFSDTLLNEVGPTGPFKLSIRHLTRLGFKVIVVPYQLFSKDITSIETLIKDEIDKIVQC